MVDGHPWTAEVVVRAKRAWANDYLVVLATDVLLGAMGLLTGILVARGLGPAGRGDSAGVLLWTTVVSTVAGFGLPHAVLYAVGRHPESRWRAVRWGWRAGAGHGFVGGMAAMCIVPAILNGRSAAGSVAVLYAVSVPINLVMQIGLGSLQGIGAYRRWCALRLLQAATYGALVALLRLGEGFSVGAVLGCQGAGMAAAAVGSAWALRKLAPGARKPEGSAIERAEAVHVRGLYLYGGGALLSWVFSAANTSADQLALAATAASSELGQYAVAVSLAGAALPVASAVGSVVVGKVARARGRSDARATARRSLGATLGVLGVAALALVLGAPLLVHGLYGDEFGEAVAPLRVLALGLPFLGGGQVAGAVLRGRGRPYAAAAGDLSGAVATGVLLALLLPRLGIVGAALASLVAYSVTFAVSSVLMARELRVPVWRLAGVNAGADVDEPDAGRPPDAEGRGPKDGGCGRRGG